MDYLHEGYFVLLASCPSQTSKVTVELNFNLITEVSFIAGAASASRFTISHITRRRFCNIYLANDC